MFTYQTKIKMHHTDAAGRLFFGHQFALCHEAYENFLEHISLPFAELLRTKNYFLPIIHAEADYKKQLFVGDLIEIELKVTNIGQTSFTMGYDLKDTKGQVVGTASTTHVSIDNKAQTKITLPQELKEKLERFAVINK